MNENTITRMDFEDIKTNLTELLHNNVVEVTFTKVDGNTRIMNCTLEPSFLPESIEKENIRVKNKDILSVWDTEKNGWRSFRWDSVIEFRLTPNV